MTDILSRLRELQAELAATQRLWREDSNAKALEIAKATTLLTDTLSACKHKGDPRGCYRVRCQLGRKCVEASRVRYVLCPGMVISRNDGQQHYIGAMALARLYGVDPKECEIFEPAAWWPRSFWEMAEERSRGLLKLNTL